jgi:hypothetical protein
VSSRLWHRVVGVYHRLGGSCCLHLEGLSVNVGINRTNVSLILITYFSVQIANSEAKCSDKRGTNSIYATTLWDCEVIVFRLHSSVSPGEWRLPEIGREEWAYVYHLNHHMYTITFRWSLLCAAASIYQTAVGLLKLFRLYWRRAWRVDLFVTC